MEATTVLCEASVRYSRPRDPSPVAVKADRTMPSGCQACQATNCRLLSYERSSNFSSAVRRMHSGRKLSTTSAKLRSFGRPGFAHALKRVPLCCLCDICRHKARSQGTRRIGAWPSIQTRACGVEVRYGQSTLREHTFVRHFHSCFLKFLVSSTWSRSVINHNLACFIGEKIEEGLRGSASSTSLFRKCVSQAGLPLNKFCDGCLHRRLFSNSSPSNMT